MKRKLPLSTFFRNNGALMGTIMAATTGIVGASVVMLTMIALPSMLERGYDKQLAVGTIASAGTLGILVPPSIMLVIMGDQLSLSVGELFMGAVGPGLLLGLAQQAVYRLVHGLGGVFAVVPGLGDLAAQERVFLALAQVHRADRF